MATLNFPSSPTDGQEYTVNGIVWRYYNAYGVWRSGASTAGDIAGSQANLAFAKANSAANTAYNRVNVGGTMMLANSNSEIFTLIQGSNITLTIDPPNDAITISSTGGGGGNAFGNVIANGTTLVADSGGAFMNVVAGIGVGITGNATNDSIIFHGQTFIGDSPPSDPRPGTQWWNSNTGTLYIYYTDTDSSQWVTASGFTNPANTGVTPGTYGGIDSSNTVSLTVDASGRITAASNVAAIIFRQHTFDTAGVNTAAQLQNWFPTLGNVTVVAGTTYLVDAMLCMHSTATTHTTSIQIAGTATIDEFMLEVAHSDIANNVTRISSTAAQAIQYMIWRGPAALMSTAVVMDATSTVGQSVTIIRGFIKVNAGGTLLPRFSMSAVGAPFTGSASNPLIKKGTYFSLFPTTSNTVNAIGGWA